MAGVDLFGGSDSFKSELATEMESAAAQVEDNSKVGDVKSARLPSFVLASDAWLPLFKKGYSVDFHTCPADSGVPGDFVVVRQRARLSIVRLIEWRFDGSSIGIFVRESPKSSKVTQLAKGTFLGIVDTVGEVGDNERYRPNERSWFATARGMLTKYGTCDIFTGTLSLLREAVFVASTRPPDTRPKEVSFWQSLRNVNKWHAESVKQEQEEARVKALQEAAAKEELEKTKEELGQMNPNQWWKKE